MSETIHVPEGSSPERVRRIAESVRTCAAVARDLAGRVREWDRPVTADELCALADYLMENARDLEEAVR